MLDHCEGPSPLQLPVRRKNSERVQEAGSVVVAAYVLERRTLALARAWSPPARSGAVPMLSWAASSKARRATWNTSHQQQ